MASKDDFLLLYPYCPTKEKNLTRQSVQLRKITLTFLVSPMVLGVTVVIYFLVKTIKLIHNIYSHDKGGLKYPKDDIN